MNPISAPDRALADAESFAVTVQQAGTRLFARSSTARALEGIVERMLEDCRRLHERGAAAIPAIALVGRVGEGKSWLARCFLTPSPEAERVRAELKSGQNDTDRTHTIVWFGPEKPFGLAPEGERFLAVSRALMLDLGAGYLVGDTPGFSDRDPRAWRLAGLAATSAPVKLVITSVSQLRDGGTEHFIGTMNGALILPVVRFEPEAAGEPDPPEIARRDVLAELGKWSAQAPQSRILDPIFMPQRGIFGEAAAERLMRERLAAALVPCLAEVEGLRRGIEDQLAARVRQARREIADALAGFYQRLGEPVRRVAELAGQMSDRVQDELLGETSRLHAAIRHRLRADWLERTPALCFPFRTFAGLFALTHGAWDRVFFSAAGSVPSLALALFKTTTNLRDAHRLDRFYQTGLEARISRLLAEEFQPAVRHFEAALGASLPTEPEGAAPRAIQVHCAGLPELETAARRLLHTSIQRHRAASLVVWLFALLGTASFFALIAGPVISLYRHYWQAHGRALAEVAGQWGEFPQPTFAMIFASLLLSVAPAVLLALTAIAFACRAGRVRHIAQDFITAVREETAHRLADGRLAIYFDEPKVDAARALLAFSTKD
jgi:hypothetical protein